MYQGEGLNRKPWKLLILGALGPGIYDAEV